MGIFGPTRLYGSAVEEDLQRAKSKNPLEYLLRRKIHLCNRRNLAGTIRERTLKFFQKKISKNCIEKLDSIINRLRPSSTSLFLQL